MLDKTYTFQGPPLLATQLDDLRRSLSPIPSRSELIRLFIDEGIEKMIAERAAAQPQPAKP